LVALHLGWHHRLSDRNVGDSLEPGDAGGSPEQSAEDEESGADGLLWRTVLDAPVHLGPSDLLECAPVEPDSRQGPAEADRASLHGSLQILDRRREPPLRRDRRSALAAGGERKKEERDGEGGTDPAAPARSFGSRAAAQGISRSPRASARAR